LFSSEVGFVRKNRDRIRIVAALLEAAGTGTKKTRIMFEANLSFKLLEKYLKTALDLSLVKANGSVYQLTEQGRAFLNRYWKFSYKYFQVQKEYEDLFSERETLERLCEEPIEDTEDEPD
jgi:predicted transcriptional regulator